MTSLTLTLLGLTTGGLIILLAAVARLSRRKRAAASARLDLLGASAVVETVLEPEGSVLVRGELWRARSRERVERGARVRVVGAGGHLLEVAPTRRALPT